MSDLLSTTGDYESSRAEPIPDEIYEPFGMHGVWALRVVAVLWVCIAACLALPVNIKRGWPLVAVVGAFAVATALANEISYRWWRSYRRKTYRQGQDATAKVIRRRIAMRGGYMIVDIEYELRGTRRRSSGRIGVRTNMQYADGERMPIRVRPIRLLGVTLWESWLAIPTGPRTTDVQRT